MPTCSNVFAVTTRSSQASRRSALSACWTMASASGGSSPNRRRSSRNRVCRRIPSDACRSASCRPCLSPFLAPFFHERLCNGLPHAVNLLKMDVCPDRSLDRFMQQGLFSSLSFMIYHRVDVGIRGHTDGRSSGTTSFWATWRIDSTTTASGRTVSSARCVGREPTP